MDTISSHNHEAILELDDLVQAVRKKAEGIREQFFEDRSQLEEKNKKRYRLQPVVKVTPRGGVTLGWSTYKPNSNGKVVTEYIRKGQGLNYQLSDLRRLCADEQEYALVKSYEQRFARIREYLENISKARRLLQLALNRLEEIEEF